MPYKDPEARRQYMREYGKKWYERNREKVIAQVKERKHTVYAGTCKNCGGHTVGSTKNAAPDYCAKPDCARAQRQRKA